MILLYSSEWTMIFNERLCHEDAEPVFESQWLVLSWQVIQYQSVHVKLQIY